MTARYYLGLMSGTSLDGLDIALCEFNSDGKPQLHAFQSVPLDASLKDQLWQLTQSTAGELERFGAADRRFAVFCASAVKQFLAQHHIAPEAVVAIGSHGQTVRHRPQADPAFTLQLGCAATIAALTGIDTIANFRQKDIALGGQGAPLAPAFHRALFHQQGSNRAIVNIGGIANVTLFSAQGDVTGFDTGPGNGLMDSWFQAHHPHATVAYDDNGQWAHSGKLLPELLERCLADPYFQRQGPKSTGREYFHLSWLEEMLSNLRAEPADVQRTLLELTATSIAQPLKLAATEACFVCGGGAYNSRLQGRLAALLPGVTVNSSASLGIDPDAVEALAFAWLAWCFTERRKVALSAVTGSQRDAILGALYPAG